MDAVGYQLLDQSAPVPSGGRPHDWGPVDDQIAGSIDATPSYAAAIALGALVVLVALKAAGFRFSFGVNVGR